MLSQESRQSLSLTGVSVHNSLKLDKPSLSLLRDNKKHENESNSGIDQMCKYERCKQNGSYRHGKCKQHFITTLMKEMRKEIRNLYRGPDRAYAALDFTGVGHITEQCFLDSMISKRLQSTKGYSFEDIKDFFFSTNVFSGRGMNFDSFKKTFFPHLYQIKDDNTNEDFTTPQEKEQDLIKNKAEHQLKIHERVKKLENLLKVRFSNFDSVRKAFLGLDTDYDGYITVEDILRYFGQDSKDFNFNDLRKLITEKDSTGRGMLGYADFSKWVGNSIHQSEGFYFRHDSVKNPQFEQRRESEAQKMNDRFTQEATKNLINATLEKTVIEKIKSQWKTIRKAFTDMNKEKDQVIEEDELRFYLQHWGLNLNNEQFKQVFKMFDYDGDGSISYQDFHKSVGSEIHPGESLYFRQDKPHFMRINKCQHPKCWQATQSLGENYCALHNKMYIDQGIVFFQTLFYKIGASKWPEFIREIKSQAEKDEDYKQIFFSKFTAILDIFGIRISEKDKQLIQSTFPGRNEGDKVRINIQKLYDVHYQEGMNKVYQDIHLPDTDKNDVAIDASGYIGIFHRANAPDESKLLPFSIEQLSLMFHKIEDATQRNNKLALMMRMIKQIDKDNNGYVTSTELDDILKIIFPEQLTNRNLKPIFKEFESIQNRILIDYKRFRDKLIRMIQTLKDIKKEMDFREKSKPRRVQLAEKLIQMRESRSGVDRCSTTIRKSMQTVDHDQRGSSVEDLTAAPRRISLNSRTSKSALGHHFKSPSTNDVNQVAKSRLNNIFLQPRISIQEINVTNKQLAKSFDFTNTKGIGTDLARGSLENTDYKNSILDDLKVQDISQHRLKTVSNRYGETPYKQEERPGSTTMIQARSTLFNSAGKTGTLGNQKSKQLQMIRTKLQYEWKNIFRQLSSADTNLQNPGITSKKKFDEVLQSNGVYISKEELKLLLEKFGLGNQTNLNYLKMSQEFGFNSLSINIMRSTHSKINKLKAETNNFKVITGAYSKNYIGGFKVNNCTKL